MKSFVLENMLLLSRQEKRARKVSFHPQTTLVRGDNDTGKSSLLKSIYACFGAKPEVVNETWTRANVSGLVTFTIDGVRKTVARDGKRYALFDESGKLTGVYSSVVNGLGPVLAELFGFDLRLVSREDRLITPPPAYFFLPFYIDQDQGWGDTWSGFAGLPMVPGYKRILAEYHAGLKPNEYYKARGDYTTLKATLKDPSARLDVLQRLLLNIEERMRVAIFDIDIESYRREIEELLGICDGLHKKEEALKDGLVRQYGDKTQIEHQIAVAKAAVAELRDDFQYASRKLKEVEVTCPTCGQHHDNSFLARFSLAHDENRCEELLVELHDDLDEVDREVTALTAKHTALTQEIARVNEILSAKQGDIKLKDLIESEGRKEVQRVLRADIDKVKEEIAKIEARLTALKSTMDSFEDRKRVKKLTGEFRDLMNEHLGQLSVAGIPTKKLYVYSRIAETGSDLPRALLAYNYSILHMMEQYSSATFATLVIDSPNQQDQDPSNYIKMLEFIRDRRPKGSQLVLGVVDNLGVDFDGTLIELNDKYHLLQEGGFADHAEEAESFFSQMIG